MKLQSIFTIAVLLTCICCTDIGVSTSEIAIKNETNHSIRLLFYNVEGNNETLINTVFSKENNPFLLKKVFNPDIEGNDPFKVFNCNQIVVVFNNEKMEIHNYAGPNRSLLDFGFSDYVNVDGVGVYSIIEENYNNAVPCDGSCD